MKAEFVEGNRATRFKLLAFAAVVFLLIVLERLTTPDGALRATDPTQAFKKSLDRLLIVALAAVPLFGGVSISLVWLGIKVKRSGQYPPPGMRVAVRTKVRRGRRATWNAILMFVLAGFSVVLALVPLYAWHLSSRLASELGRPNKQMQPAPGNGAADLRRWGA